MQPTHTNVSIVLGQDGFNDRDLTESTRLFGNAEIIDDLNECLGDNGMALLNSQQVSLLYF